MTLPETPEIRQLICTKAALARHHGADDERTQAVASRLRVIAVRTLIQELSEAERQELTALLAVA